MIKLGLDLGVGSLGWALIEEIEEGRRILGMGSRVIPLSVDEIKDFTQGSGLSLNQKRTAKRTQRRGYDRYQLRRAYLIDTLRRNQMLPDNELVSIARDSLWKLRSNAVDKRVELKELGRILLHINQKRGYKSSRSDANLGKKDTDYVKEVKSRYEKLNEEGLTIGQYFYQELQRDMYFRVKGLVYPREAYLDEYDALMEQQKQHFPGILTDELVSKIRNEIIFYQRKLKSQKGLVSVCEFEGFWKKSPRDSREYFVGPKVAHRSSPIFQLCKIWETINSIRITNKYNDELIITIEQKQAIFSFLDSNERMSMADLYRILGIRKVDGWDANKQIHKGLTGNTTKWAIAKCLEGEYQHLLSFNTSIEKGFKIDRATGEVLDVKVVSPKVEVEPLYKLWHTIYSITDEEECSSALQKLFGLNADVAAKLARIDFAKQGFGNKSGKAMRKMLPYLMDGLVYSEACSEAGYNHSASLTKEENLRRKLLERLPAVEKNSLRQPVVEKILNQMVNLVNALCDKYGKPDTIVVELARELKQSKDERNETFIALSKREKENANIVKELEEKYGLRATRNNVLKWRLFQEIRGNDSKHTAICVYCGQLISLSAAINGEEVDVEHIIPKSLIFDDSQSNKTLAHRRCNADKNNMTAYDFMKQTKSDEEFNRYVERVNYLYSNGVIKKGKKTKLLMSASEIPSDFIDRQLRQSQYIARKSYEMLSQICRDVYATGGGVTEYLRRCWGWDDVLMNLQLPKHREAGETEIIEIEEGGQIHKKEIIKGWSKRLDHRHHAIDALTIACTKKSFIQRINRLSSENTRQTIYEELEKLNDDPKKKRSLLERYIVANMPFTTKEVMDEASKILVSFKSGKKVATFAKRKVKIEGRKKVVQEGIVVPRGALSEESVYGSINVLDKGRQPKYLFENSDLIVKPKIRSLVKERINQHNGDIKKALSSLKKDPIYLDAGKSILLEYASCFKKEYVVKYPISSLKAKDIDSIVDLKVREKVREHLASFGNNEREAFKNDVWYNKEKGVKISSVRCFTGLSAVVPVSRNENGEAVGFVKPGNNHHVAIYRDEGGKLIEHICTLWHAVERKKYGFPVVIQNPSDVWSVVLSCPDKYPSSFVENLPQDGCTLELSMQQNEMFVLGMLPSEVEEAIESNSYRVIGEKLYRVQKLTSSDYYFRFHLETQVLDDKSSKLIGKFLRVQSIGKLMELHPVKIRITNIGTIVVASSSTPSAKGRAQEPASKE
jgi:CRISPR-associated endonuclease Csn1